MFSIQKMLFLALKIFRIAQITLPQIVTTWYRGGFRVQKKVVTNFCEIDTIYIKVIALIFVVTIIIANVATLFCFDILVITAW